VEENVQKSKPAKIVLVLAANREAKKAVEVAVNQAEQSNAELAFLLVLEPEMAKSIASLMISQGWIGGKPTDKLLEALRNEIAAHGQAEVERAALRARERGIRYKTEIRRGDFVQEVLAFAREVGADHIIVTRRKRWPLARMLFGSAVSALRDLSSCPVQVVDED
jgi:nucleotide-binding universal stress UspA family protein